jgi:hypothetical protein
MNTSSSGFVPLRKASLCMDCEMLTIGLTHCLACGSRALLSVDRALSRHRPFNPAIAERAVVVSMSRARAKQPTRIFESAQVRGRGNIHSIGYAFSPTENPA